MAYLIRFINKTAAGSIEHHDRRVDAPTITIGRSTDQVLHLKDRRTRLQHAEIELGKAERRISRRRLWPV